ncbi:uncharacterized protein V1516DRAFT_682623 [Lipomyces oligophaga]|uniref:uncharacterized protein n=1 Tax=Lipomyces oligophaga TaxID=45792 RepID=UPI0034CF412E
MGDLDFYFSHLPRGIHSDYYCSVTVKMKPRYKKHVKTPKGPRRFRQHSPPVLGNKHEIREKKKLSAGNGTQIGNDLENKNENKALVRYSAKARVKKSRKKKEAIGGDTPRAFVELMDRMNGKRTHITAMSSQQLEKSEKSSKIEQKQKQRQEAIEKAQEHGEPLKIRPDESLFEFSRRVDTALPMVKGKTGVPSSEAIRRLKKRAKAEANGQKFITRKSKSNSNDVLTDDGEDYSDEEKEEQRYQDLKSRRSGSPDPWLKVKGTLSKPKFGEVADGPPVLNPPSKKLLSVPKTAGTLAQRMVLEAERNMIIAKYRAMQERKLAKVIVSNTENQV